MITSFNRDNFIDFKMNIEIENITKIFQKIILNSKISNNFIIQDISSTIIFRKNSLIFIKEKLKNNNLDYDNICFISNNVSFLNDAKIKNFILVDNIEKAYNQIINYLYIHDDHSDYADNFSHIKNSFISKKSNVHPSSILFNNCTIGKGVIIGKNCIIKNNVIIKNAIIGDNVIISDNTVVGSSGFGFDLKNMGAKNISPQIGIVHVDDNVHIGANCTIDRAKIDITYIGKNSMIDNMVHIGHNVILGNNACIAAQSGISGSVIIGDNLISGGQSGYAGHIKIGNNVTVAAKSGVTKNIKDNSIIAGYPAIDIKDWKKRIIREKHNGYKRN